MVWVDTEGDAVVRFNTPHGSLKYRHLERDPRVSLVVIDPAEMYRWVGVTGTAELTAEGADEHIDALAKTYLGADSYPFRRPGEQRVMVRIRVDKVDGIGVRPADPDRGCLPGSQTRLYTVPSFG